MTEKKAIYGTPDEAALTLARQLLSLTHAALAYGDSETGLPGISRIAFGRDAAGVPLTLVSGLTAHAPALARRPDCALLLGEVAERGDPLTHPRLMIRARAEFTPEGERALLRDHWLKGHPKAALYVDLPDFRFVRLHPTSVLLNAGFGRAYALDGLPL